MRMWGVWPMVSRTVRAFMRVLQVRCGGTLTRAPCATLRATLGSNDHALHPEPMLPERLAASADLFEASPQLFAAFDADDRLQWANSSFRAALGLQADEFPTWAEMMRLSRQRGCGPVIDVPDFEAWLASTLGRRGKRSYRAIESRYRDGRWVLMTETCLPNGGMLCVGTDVTNFFVAGRELREARDDAIKAAVTDELTQLANRRSFAAQLEDWLREPGHGFGLVLLDIDHFKRINEQWGHKVGDAVLVAFAGVLRSLIRRDDVAARWGGEEFALLLREHEPQRLLALLERLLAAVREMTPVGRLPSLRCSTSAGVVLALPGDSADEMLRRADEALYAAKHAGRDRLQLAPPLG
ncbi:MAG: hypothetical protein C0460_03530 [Methylibium sp.]|nr:hypothetical protein [Methylibium sp.]